MTDMTKKNRLLGRNAAENGKQRKTRIFAVERAAHQTLDVVLAWLSATPAGLSAEEAKKRLDIYGRNEVAQEKAPPVYRQLLGAYNSPFIYVLLVLVAISCFTDVWLPLAQGEEAEPAGIVIMSTMIILSGLLRFWQEFRTNKAAQALKSMVKTTATVRRPGDGSSALSRAEVDISVGVGAEDGAVAVHQRFPFLRFGVNVNGLIAADDDSLEVLLAENAAHAAGAVALVEHHV